MEELHNMTQIKLRRDTSTNFTSKNPILGIGEPAYETDTKKLKVGDGTTAYNSLAYFVMADEFTIYREKYGAPSDSTPVINTGNSITIKAGVNIETPNGTLNNTADITYTYDFTTDRVLFVTENDYYHAFAVYYGGREPSPIGEQIFWFNNNVWTMIAGNGTKTVFNTQKITPIAKIYQTNSTVKNIDYSSFAKISGGGTSFNVVQPLKLVDGTLTLQIDEQTIQVQNGKLVANLDELGNEVNTLAGDVAGVQADLANKQDKSTAVTIDTKQTISGQKEFNNTLLLLSNNDFLRGQQSTSYRNGAGLSMGSNSTSTDGGPFTPQWKIYDTSGGVDRTETIVTTYNQSKLNSANFNAASKLVRLDSDGKLPAVDGSKLTNLPSSSSSVEKHGLEGDYCSKYGIVDCPNGILVKGTGKVTLKAGVVMQMTETDGLTTNASDMAHDITSTVDFDLFYTSGSLLEATQVVFSEQEPEDGATGVLAWYNGTQWKFKSNDAGNVWRTAPAVRLAHFHITDGNITRIDYIGNRHLNKVIPVTVDSTQTISGEKTFSSKVTINAKTYMKDDLRVTGVQFTKPTADNAIYDANNLVLARWNPITKTLTIGEKASSTVIGGGNPVTNKAGNAFLTSGDKETIMGYMMPDYSTRTEVPWGTDNTAPTDGYVEVFGEGDGSTSAFVLEYTIDGVKTAIASCYATSAHTNFRLPVICPKGTVYSARGGAYGHSLNFISMKGAV